MDIALVPEHTPVNSASYFSAFLTRGEQEKQGWAAGERGKPQLCCQDDLIPVKMAGRWLVVTDASRCGLSFLANLHFVM